MWDSGWSAYLSIAVCDLDCKGDTCRGKQLLPEHSTKLVRFGVHGLKVLPLVLGDIRVGKPSRLEV